METMVPNGLTEITGMLPGEHVYPKRSGKIIKLSSWGNKY